MVVFSDFVVGAGRGAAQVPQGDWLRGTISAAVRSSDSAFKCAYFGATCRHARIFEGVEMTMPSSEPPTKSIAAPPHSIPQQLNYVRKLHAEKGTANFFNIEDLWDSSNRSLQQAPIVKVACARCSNRVDDERGGRGSFNFSVNFDQTTKKRVSAESL